MSSEVLQRELELLRLAPELNLDHDGRLQRHGDVGRHDGQVRLTDVMEQVGK